MSQHVGCKANEVFVGNVDMGSWPLDYLRGLRTIRLGEQALDINGEKLSPLLHRPMFIHRDEAPEYDRIMMRRTFPGWRGERQ